MGLLIRQVRGEIPLITRPPLYCNKMALGSLGATVNGNLISNSPRMTWVAHYSGPRDVPRGSVLTAPRGVMAWEPRPCPHQGPEPAGLAGLGMPSPGRDSSKRQVRAPLEPRCCWGSPRPSPHASVLSSHWVSDSPGQPESFPCPLLLCPWPFTGNAPSSGPLN